MPLWERIVYVELDDVPITDADLKLFKPLVNLGTLDLSDKQISDAGLEHLKELTSLTQLLFSQHASHRSRFAASERAFRSSVSVARWHASHGRWA